MSKKKNVDILFGLKESLGFSEKYKTSITPPFDLKNQDLFVKNLLLFFNDVSNETHKKDFQSSLRAELDNIAVSKLEQNAQLLANYIKEVTEEYTTKATRNAILASSSMVFFGLGIGAAFIFLPAFIPFIAVVVSAAMCLISTCVTIDKTIELYYCHQAKHEINDKITIDYLSYYKDYERHDFNNTVKEIADNVKQTTGNVYNRFHNFNTKIESYRST